MYRAALMLIICLKISPICYGEPAMGHYSFLNGSLDSFRKQYLEQVNKYRKIHGVHELAYTTEMNEVSQQHAEVLASSGRLYYSNSSYGETTYRERSSKIDGYYLADYFYQSGHLYNYKRGSSLQITSSGNFNNMVSRKSCFMGIGVARLKSDYIYVVVNYSPGYFSPKNIPSIFPPGGVLNTDLTPYEYKITEPVCEDADEETYLKQNLECHNALRKMHGAPPLTYKDEMNKYTQNKAAVLAGKDVKLYFGEKSYKIFSYSYNNFYDPILNGYRDCREQYIKGKNYSMNIFHSLDEFPLEENPANHFTQMIWYSTRYMGFGMARNRIGTVHTVLVYDPPGNIKGYYKQNVFPEQLRKKSSLPVVNVESTIFNLPFILLLVVALVLFSSAIGLHLYYYFKSRNNRSHLRRSPMPLPSRNSVEYDECGYIN